MADLNPIIQAANSVSSSISQAAQAIGSIGSQQSDITSQIGDIYETMGDNARTVSVAQSSGEMQIQSAMNQYASNLLAGNDDASIKHQKELSDEILAQEQIKRAAIQRIGDKKNINPLEDIVGWIGAQFTVNDDIHEYNAANMLQNEDMNHMNAINEMISRKGQAEQYLKTTVTAASAQAAADNAALAFKTKADEAKLQGLAYNADTINKLTSLSTQQLQVASQVFSAQQSYEANQRAVEQLGLERQRFAFERDQMAERLKDKKETDQAYQSVADTIKLGLHNLYGDDAQVNNVMASPVTVAMIKGKVPMDDRLKAAYDSGRASQVSGGLKVIASNPADLVRKVATINPNLTPDQQKLASVAIETRNELLSDNNNTADAQEYKAAIKAKDAVGAETILNKATIAKMQMYSSKVTGPDNPYYLPPADQIVATTPGLQQLPVWQKVLAPLKASGADLSDPNVAFQQTIQAVRDGKINSTEAAAGLSAIYLQGERLNITSKKFNELGFPTSAAYNVPVNTTGGAFGTSVVNLASASDTLRAMVKRMTANTPVTNTGKPLIDYMFPNANQQDFPGTTNP